MIKKIIIIRKREREGRDLFSVGIIRPILGPIVGEPGNEVEALLGLKHGVFIRDQRPAHCHHCSQYSYNNNNTNN